MRVIEKPAIIGSYVVHYQFTHVQRFDEAAAPGGDDTGA